MFIMCRYVFGNGEFDDIFIHRNKLLWKLEAYFPCLKLGVVEFSLGIGPTHDDMTYEGIAAAFQDTLELNEELRSYWAFFNKDPNGSNLWY